MILFLIKSLTITAEYCINVGSTQKYNPSPSAVNWGFVSPLQGNYYFPVVYTCLAKAGPCNVKMNVKQISGILPKIVRIKRNEFFLRMSLGLASAA